MLGSRRNQFRINSQPESEIAVLRRGTKEQQVRLLNQSSEGFAIASDGLKLNVGESVHLRTARGWSEAEVLRCDPQEGKFHLGLKLTRDLPDPRDKIRTTHGLFWTGRASGSASKSGPLLTLTAVAILGFWVYLAFSAFQYHH